ncbi:MAG: hypothetical protein AB4372_08670 [Xenococcus sp. (in: cyanobacteria)]
MKAKRIEDILNAHQTFAQQMQEQMQKFSQQTGSDNVLLDKQAQLRQYEQRLSITTEAKEKTIKRYDEERRRYEEAIARLKQEIQTED